MGQQNVTVETGLVAPWITRALSALALAARSRRGVAAAEYAILAVAVVVVVGIAVRQLIDPTTGAYVQLGAVLSTTQEAVASNVNPGSR